MNTLKRVIFIFPVILIFCFILLKIKCNDVYANLIQEDNLVENAEVVAYVLSSLFALSIAIDFFKSKYKLCGFLYIALLILFIFICGEEISWGQRLFNLEISEIFKKYSIQKELNLHNLGILHYLFYGLYVLVGFLGAFSWFLLPKKARNKNDTAVNPVRKGRALDPTLSIRSVATDYLLSSQSPRWAGLSNGVNFFVPAPFLFFYFFPAFIIYTLYCIYGAVIILFGTEPFSIGNGSFFVWRDQEPAELLLALGFLFFMIINKYRQELYQFNK